MRKLAEWKGIAKGSNSSLARWVSEASIQQGRMAMRCDLAEGSDELRCRSKLLPSRSDSCRSQNRAVHKKMPDGPVVPMRAKTERVANRASGRKRPGSQKCRVSERTTVNMPDGGCNLKYGAERAKEATQRGKRRSDANQTSGALIGLP